MKKTTAPNSVAGAFVDDNPSLSQQGTLIIALDQNARQDEIVNAIEGAQLTPSSGDNTQLLQALAVFTPLGVPLPYCGSSAPAGHFLCDGQAVSRATYAALFAVLGTAYGIGDGSTTFNLPDMRAAVPVGAGTSTQFTQNETKTLGTAYDDKAQGHSIEFLRGSGSPSDLNAVNAGFVGYTPDLNAYQEKNGTPEILANLITDGTNGAPRFGDSTHGKQVAVNYILRKQ